MWCDENIKNLKETKHNLYMTGLAKQPQGPHKVGRPFFAWTSRPLEQLGVPNSTY